MTLSTVFSLALVAILVIASWVIVATAVAAHQRGMARVRRAARHRQPSAATYRRIPSQRRAAR